MRTFAILAAGGSGSRMGLPYNKVLQPLQGRTILSRSICLFDGIVDRMILVCRPEDFSTVRHEVDLSPVSFPIQIVPGGMTRQASVLNGLKALDAAPDDVVLIHDAARCLTPKRLIAEAVYSCISDGPCVPGVPAVNTIKLCKPYPFVTSTLDRSALFEIQTPQVFPFGLLFSSYLQAESDGFQATDDASVVEHAGIPLRIIPGFRWNLKITEKEDLVIADAFLNHQSPSAFRIGMGYDVHQLAENRKLILCGVEIPFEKGLLGHSDADVAVHALMDALLGAAALGDIGHLFPDTSPEYEGISSMILLEKVTALLRQNGYVPVNTDLTIVAQRPKLAPFISEMRKNIAAALFCDASRISVKATTTENLGFEGRQEGISAQAVCLIQTASADQSAGSCIPPEDSVQGKP
ncbi:MAG: 2-C-methyl-D-erythritol 2,4-cyclodiphosphate synthase [Clostridia bacterium]|nr:2-C-methyl-D-erythritol 2,4-cyclodiphosphate synthase [Clostridia bacterium]